MALLANPEPNIKSLKEMLQISKDNDHAIAKPGVLSMLAVFKDIIPGYRIRLPTEKELEMKVSKDVKNMRFNESTLLSAQGIPAVVDNVRKEAFISACCCSLYLYFA